MKVKIKHYDGIKESYCEYDAKKDNTVLENLNHIKTTQNNALTFRSGCQSGICGCCSVKVNSKTVLACQHKEDESYTVEAINFHSRIRDLVVDYDNSLNTLITTTSWIEPNNNNQNINQDDVKITQVQSNCILCSSCFSVCPVLGVNKEFLGPFSLSRVIRYQNDKRDKSSKDRLQTIQKNGIWDCTLCGECTYVCPQGLDPKNDILKLRSKSIMQGFSDPNPSMGSFDMDFGFSTF